MRRPADSEVDLDGKDVPFDLAGSAAHDEVDAETTDHPFPGEDLADSPTSILNLPTVCLRGREPASLVDVARWATENLVVRRQKHDFALRIDAKLHARRSRVGVFEELFDDAAHLENLRR